MGVVAINERVALTALQRLSSLLPSSAPRDEKLRAAALMGDSLTEKMGADLKKKDHKNKLQLDST